MLICNERCRRTQEREPAHTEQCPATQRYQISQNFELGPRQNWFISRFRRRCSLWCSTGSCGQILLLYSDYSSFSQLICELNIATLLTLDNYRYQTHERNITKFYLLIPKHLIIRLTKLPVCTLKLSTTFWHCRKNSDYFWTRVYIGGIPGGMTFHDDIIKWKHFPRYWTFYEGNPPVTGGFPSQRPVARSFDVFFDLRLNKRLSKQSRRLWFETQSRSLWRYCNGKIILIRWRQMRVMVS